MKRSYIIASIIILFGAIISWLEWQKSTGAKEQNAQLIQAPPTLNSAHHQETSQKNRRDSRDTASASDGKALARELIHSLRLSKGYKSAQNPSETYSYERKKDIYKRLYDLPFSQIKLFFEEFYHSADSSELSKSDISETSYYLMQILAPKYPTEMIDLLNKSPEIFTNDQENINSYQWAIIYHTAHDKNDPATAYQCLAKLANAEPSLQSKIISTIIDAAKTPGKRTETLEAMRAYATTPEQKKLVMKHMVDLAFGNGSLRPGFAETSDWLNSAALSTEELKSATMGIQKKVQTGDIAQWIDWLSSSGLPEKDTQARVYLLADEWTNKDYQAVGNWLNNAPDSPQKHAAIGAYAINTYPHDPENAMKWAQTLPGPLRSNCLRLIYGMIPKDSDAAKAFSKEHGVN